MAYNADEELNAYLEKYCAMYLLTPEEAREHSLVKEVYAHYKRVEGGLE